MIIRLYVSSKLFHAETFIDFISDPFCGVSLLNKHQACANTTKTIPEFQRAPSPKRMQELRDVMTAECALIPNKENMDHFW